MKSGQTDAGLQALEEAFALIRSTGERFWEAELHRLGGELRLAADAMSAIVKSEASFLQAIKVAERQGAKLLLLRAGVALGRMRGGHERGAQAKQLVAEARGHIDEPKLPDMIEAQALCENAFANRTAGAASAIPPLAPLISCRKPS